MKFFQYIIAFILTLTLISCAAPKYQIGGGKPDKEINQCIRLASKGKYEDSIQCLEMFKTRYPKTKWGQEAELMIGDAYFAKKEYLLAAESYNAFIRLHPLNSRGDYAHFRMGLSYFKEAPKAIDRDQNYLDDAIKHLRIVIRRYPRSTYRNLARSTLKKARSRLARHNYYVGHYYYRTGQYISCIPRFAFVAERYPDSGLADKSLYFIVKASIKLERLEEAKEAYSILTLAFPKSEYVKRAERKLLSAAKKK